jgi:hypothetical protein
MAELGKAGEILGAPFMALLQRFLRTDGKEHGNYSQE